MQTLGEIRGLYRMIVTGINRRGTTITPRGEDVVKTGDTLYFVCNKRDLPAITDLFGFEERRSRRTYSCWEGAQLAGGSRRSWRNSATA